MTDEPKRIVDVTFRSLSDFQGRIAALWQNQKDDEVYNFIFLCAEAEDAFNDLVKAFSNEE